MSGCFGQAIRKTVQCKNGLDGDLKVVVCWAWEEKFLVDGGGKFFPNGCAIVNYFMGSRYSERTSMTSSHLLTVSAEHSW